MNIYEKILAGAGPEILAGPPPIDSNDFPFTEAVNRGDISPLDPFSLDDLSENDEPMEYTELIMNSAFIGTYPIDTILESITEQFKDYIGTEDRTNYVDIFYRQLHESYKVADDEEEGHPVEIKDVLEWVYGRFVDTMQSLIEQRLGLSIDEQITDEETLEYIFKRVYEFFILNARNNFKRVISKDINSKIATVIEDDKTFIETIESMLRYYSPLMIALEPIEFLKLAGDERMEEIFRSGQILGNFLTKYSAKLYQYDDFKADIISNIIMVHDLKEEIEGGRHDEQQ